MTQALYAHMNNKTIKKKRSWFALPKLQKWLLLEQGFELNSLNSDHPVLNFYTGEPYIFHQ
jgi:hypothetical protein